MICGFELSQGWMIGREAGNFLFKIDVMGPLMHKSILRDHWFHPIESALDSLRAQETWQVEKSLILKIRLTSGAKRTKFCTVRLVNRVAVGVNNIHKSSAVVFTGFVKKKRQECPAFFIFFRNMP
jgi:hypothetical protein